MRRTVNNCHSQHLPQNTYINKLRKAIQSERAAEGNPISDVVAVEEALAETRAAVKTGKYEANKARYGVDAPKEYA